MKKKMPPELKLGRIRMGKYASDDSYGWDGAFQVRRKNPNGRVVTLYLVISDKGGWEHCSVSRPDGMMPTWTDMCWVKDLIWEPEECVVQYHPPQSLYVNFHPGVLHLWKPVGADFPMPPIEFV